MSINKLSDEIISNILIELSLSDKRYNLFLKTLVIKKVCKRFKRISEDSHTIANWLIKKHQGETRSIIFSSIKMLDENSDTKLFDEKVIDILINKYSIKDFFEYGLENHDYIKTFKKKIPEILNKKIFFYIFKYIFDEKFQIYLKKLKYLNINEFDLYNNTLFSCKIIRYMKKYGFEFDIRILAFLLSDDTFIFHEYNTRIVSIYSSLEDKSFKECYKELYIYLKNDNNDDSLEYTSFYKFIEFFFKEKEREKMIEEYEDRKK
jgi:hypothetical protein